ncbi:MAG: hydrogen gas-evolving membrane-bound hydrogenase subunit E [Devosia sp.]
MELSFDVFAILLLLAPFAAALLAPVIAQETGRAAGWILAIVPLGLFAFLATTIEDVASGKVVRIAIDWIPALGANLSFRLDGLSLVFALVISGIGAIIILYAGRYLLDDPRRPRFLSIMFVFMGAMIGLVVADSMIAFFAFWELTSVTSFLLIGHDMARTEARRAALQALIVTAIGGLSLLAGGVLLNAATGAWDFGRLPGFAGPLSVDSAYPWITGFIVLAAFTKSAQFPFHFWLPNAMQAPTPVSAYLHSAAMVQAGIYLLARMSPVIGGTSLWTVLLVTAGGITLLWSALWALRQSDLKQLLAQTTLAALGLMVLLLGLGGTNAAMAVAGFFIAHALYKAALFLIAGIIENSTGTRDLNALGGLRDVMTITFIATALAALSMFGLPPFLGWFAKEEVNAAGLAQIAASIVIVLGNGLLATIALALLVRPFFGPLKPTLTAPREGAFALWLGPAVLGLLGFSVMFSVAGFGETLLAPMASAITGIQVESHLALAFDLMSPPLWLSVAGWILAAVFYRQLDTIRAWLTLADRRIAWTWDKGFDQAYFGVVRFAGIVTRLLHHGRLELYLGTICVVLALILFLPLWTMTGWPALPAWPDLRLYEWATVALAVVGIVLVVTARSRLFAIAALGIQGLAVALLFILFGAPDLGFTQLMVEVLSVVILALVMTRLHLHTNDPRPYEDLARDGILALVCGVSITILLLRVLETPIDPRLSDFFAANSVAIAHGRNIVNVILVDFRGLDTLGEISVVMTAGIAILALLRRQPRLPMPVPERPRRAPRRKTVSGETSGEAAAPSDGAAA